MCALLLLEAAKKCDKVFGVHPSSIAHTTRDSKSDIAKLTNQLLEKEITMKKPDCKTPAFMDPTDSGLTTLANGKWLQKKLLSNSDDILQEENHGEVTLDYACVS